VYQHHKVEEDKDQLTKEVVKNYLCKFRALIIRMLIFCGEPVIAFFQHQVFIHSLIKQHTLVLEINVQGYSKAFGRTSTLLSKPEGMFQTDEDS